MFAGPARNRGAQEARGELLAFLDSDCITEPKWIEKMWRTHKEFECSGVAGSILNANPETSISVSSYMNEMSDFFPSGKPRYMDFLCSGNVSYKMEVFRRYGGFSPTVQLYEDVELTKRMYRGGEKLLFNPDIKVSHYHRTLPKEYFAYEFRRGRNGAMARRNGALMGAAWVKYPVLGFMAAPGLFLRKGIIFPYRMVRAYPKHPIRLLRALPYFYTALIVWLTGFLYEVVAGRKIEG
jgi:GT2 family glycosyltransferase